MTKQKAGKDTTKQVEKLFRALANRTRLRIIQLLKSGPWATVELSRKFDLSYKATHQHVYHLFEAGLLERERKGPLVYYSISTELNKPARVLLRLIK